MQREVEVIDRPRKKSSGAGAGVGLVLFSLATIVAPFMVDAIDAMARLVLLGFGVFMLILGASILTITRLYQKTGANEAFVRTGMGGQRPIIDGGAYVIPVVHEVVKVSLQTMRLDVDRLGQDALITGDNLRADVSAEFYIKVQKNSDDVIAAATSLGERSNDPNAVKTLVLQKLVSALRTVGATRTLAELHTKRDDFASAVQQIVEKDLKPNGLTLESVTISRLDQTPPSTMRGEDNVFDAQGLRTIAEITNKQKVERNRIEVEAAKLVTQQDVARDQFVFEQEVMRKKAEQEKQLSIARAEAEAKQEAATFTSQQAQLAGLAEVEKDRAIEIAQIEKVRALEIAKRQTEQANQEAEVQKHRAVDLANRDKEIAVAQKDEQKAKAEAMRLTAEREREQKTLEISMLQSTQAAERQKAQLIISEQAEIQKTKLRQEMQADVSAYAAVKQAQAEQQAAEKQAQARLSLAEAEQQAKSLEARGEEAIKMIPVNVEREMVTVEKARVEVKREDLKNQSEFATIARELQVELARINAEKEAKIAAAEAFGQALSKANLTMWGDPTTLAKMSESFFNGQQSGRYMEGLTAGMPLEVKNAAESLVSGIGSAGASLLHTLAAPKVSPEIIEEKAAPKQPKA